jgi:hypothetical protein
MRYGDWNAKNRQLWEETQRLGGNKYREIYLKLMKGKASAKSQQSHGEGTSWKRKTISVPWCDKCDEEIYGNGSTNNPYHCGCSGFAFDWDEKAYSKRTLLTNHNTV